MDVIIEIIIQMIYFGFNKEDPWWLRVIMVVVWSVILVIAVAVLYGLYVSTIS